MGDAAEFEQLVLSLLDPEPSVREPAEEVYHSLKEQPETFVSFCVNAVRNSESAVVRQSTAVLLRTELFDQPDERVMLWGYLSEGLQEQVKAELLQGLETEEERLVGRPLCELIADCYAQHMKEGKEWEDVLPFLFRTATHSSSELRAHTLFIFARLCSVQGGNLQQFFKPLRDIFGSGMTDSASLSVRLSGLNATTQFVCQLRDSQTDIVQYYEELFPAMLSVISESLNAGQEGTAMKSIQFFIDLAEFAPKFFRSNLEVVVSAMLQVATSANLLQQTRQLALEFLTRLAEAASAMMRRYDGFLDSALQVALAMMVGVEDPPGWQEHEDEDEFEITEADFGEQAIDRLACAMGGSAMLPVLLDMLPSLLQNSDWTYRHTGLIALAAVGEGSHAEMTGSLGNIVTSCLPYLFDPHPRVRYAACQLFGQLSIDFTPGFQNTFHEQLVAPLLNVMDDVEHPRTRAYGGAAMLNLVQGLHPELLDGYLQDIFAGLMRMLDNGKTKVQEQALSCVAVIAERIKAGFADYYDVFVPLLKQILFTADGDDYKELRGKAMEAVSMIGLGVGKEMFYNDALEIMDLMSSIQAQNMPPDDPQTAYFLQAWSRFAQTLEEDFVPFLPLIMPPIMEAAAIQPEFSLSDADELTDIQVGWQTVVLGSTRVQIRTSTLEDKAVATRMLVCLVRDLKDAFWEYLDDVAKLMVPLLTFYFFDDVRVAAADVCPFLLVATSKYISSSGDEAAIGYLHELFEYIFTHLLQTIHAEPDLEVLVALLEALSNCIFAVGQDSLDAEQQGNIVDLMGVLLTDMETRRGKRNDARSDPDFDAEAENSLVERAAVDELVLRMVVQVLSTTFRTHGNDFFPVFAAKLLEPFMELVQPDRTTVERQWAVCMFDDLLEFAHPAIEPVYDTIMDVVMSYAVDPDAEVRQAALYGVGAAARATGASFAPYVETALAAIRTSCSFDGARDDENTDATDNAIAALAKIISFQEGVNTDELIAFFVPQLPLANDVVEGQFVYDMLCSLIEQNNAAALGDNGANIPHLVGVLTSILGTDFASDKLTPRVVNIITQVHASLGNDDFSTIVAQMDVEDQAKIKQIFE